MHCTTQQCHCQLARRNPVKNKGMACLLLTTGSNKAEQQCTFLNVAATESASINSELSVQQCQNKYNLASVRPIFESKRDNFSSSLLIYITFETMLPLHNYTTVYKADLLRKPKWEFIQSRMFVP